MHCAFLNTFYPGFMQAHYRAQPELLQASYAEQLASLNGALFGDSDFYSGGLRKAGWVATDVIVNAAPLQAAWARENGGGAPSLELVARQLDALEPDVVYVQDLNNTPRPLLEFIKERGIFLAGQIATPVVNDIAFELYDMIVSSFPHYVDEFRAGGLTAYYQPLAFSPRVLEKVGNPSFDDRETPLSFVGGISKLHLEGNQLLGTLAERTPIHFWGYGADQLPETSPIRQRHGGELWGDAMFERLTHSQITINRHGEIAQRFCNNMRLFEATGCGSLLVTDYKDNLDELFAVGTEVVAYRSQEECIDLVQYYLDHPVEAGAIAEAGQRRCLGEHTYDQRMAETAELLERHLRYRREAPQWRSISTANVSTGYRPATAVEDRHRTAWQDPSIPDKQRALVQSELENVYAGKVPLPFQQLAELLRPWLMPHERLLEVGCASGYYVEILEYLLRQPIDYTGVDYSEALIAMARDYYPKRRFEVADGAALPFEDRSFEVVVSGGVLLHVESWREQIVEASRVAERAVILYRTPICRRGPTRTDLKRAYGVETFEQTFSEVELFAACEAAALVPRQAATFAADPASDRYHVTYLLEKGGVA